MRMSKDKKRARERSDDDMRLGPAAAVGGG